MSLLLSSGFGPWFGNFIGRDDANGVSINLFENDDNEAPIRDVTPNRWIAGGITVAFAHWSRKNFFDVFHYQIMLGNMLYVTIRIIVFIPNDAGVPHRLNLKIAQQRLLVNRLQSGSASVRAHIRERETRIPL
jgi:hypothetical protein